MSALGQERTLQHVNLMSAIPSKADIDSRECHVCFVPKADILRCNKRLLLDHFVGAEQNRCRDINAERFRGFKIDSDVKFCGL